MSSNFFEVLLWLTGIGFTIHGGFDANMPMVVAGLGLLTLLAIPNILEDLKK